MADGQVRAFIGRDREIARVRAVLDAAATGSASILLVTGDAGVGKTALVDHVLASLGEGWTILPGGALPLGSMTVPFLPLRTAARDLGDDPRIPPSPVNGTHSAAEMPVLFDEWIDVLAGVRPVALLVDDLQWADQSTLDVLMYLIAGRRTRRVCLLTTVRRGEVPDGHPLNGWLADVRRMPGFATVTLGPLNRLETSQQIAITIGAAPHESLVDDVYARARGNCYYTRLLVLGLDPTAPALPPDYPEDLKAALLSNWHGLSAEARELTTVLAVAGRRLSGQELAKLVTGELHTDDLPALLHEAVNHSVIDLGPTGTYWFGHPLQAEVLMNHLPTDELRRWHERFAEFFEAGAGEHADVETLVQVADHHLAAGHVTEAYTWALIAADAIGRAGGGPEAMRLLRRALDLHPQLRSPRTTRVDLLRRVRLAAFRLGDHAGELAAVQELLDESPPDEEPANTAELLVRRIHLRFSLGESFFELADAEEAVRVGSAQPRSWQYAYALAELSHTRMWQGLPHVGETTDAALSVAEHAGHPVGLSYACTARSISLLFEDRTVEARELAGRGCAEAVRAGDWWAFSHAALWELNATEVWMNRGHLDGLMRRRREMEALGAPHPYIAWMASIEVLSALQLGETEIAEERLKVALASSPGHLGEMSSRLAAARLANLTGRTAEAEAHLERAEELTGGRMSAFRNLEFDTVRAELLLARGDARGALDSCLRTLEQTGARPTMCEWLVPMAGRALADLVTSTTSGAASDATHLRDTFELRYPPGGTGATSWSPVVDDFFIGGHETGPVEYVHFLNAFAAWYAAESARGHRSPESARLWEVAAEALDSAGSPCEAAYAWYRCGEAHLLQHQARRADAARALRASAVRASRLGADPLMRMLEELAASARINIDEVMAPNTQEGQVPDLTPREREILAHLVAGRTYAEMARALFISEKTVSSHISNMLRKTGTTNRHEISLLARSVHTE